MSFLECYELGLWHKSTNSWWPEIYTIGMIVLICSLLHVAFSACLVHGTRMVGFNEFFFEIYILHHMWGPIFRIQLILYFREMSASWCPGSSWWESPFSSTSPTSCSALPETQTLPTSSPAPLAGHFRSTSTWWSAPSRLSWKRKGSLGKRFFLNMSTLRRRHLPHLLGSLTCLPLSASGRWRMVQTTSSTSHSNESDFCILAKWQFIILYSYKIGIYIFLFTDSYSINSVLYDSKYFPLYWTFDIEDYCRTQQELS